MSVSDDGSTVHVEHLTMRDSKGHIMVVHLALARTVRDYCYCDLDFHMKQ